MAGSNTFGGTIKLEGEKEYRKAISQINSDLKVLASEMGKVTAEFGKNNKSVSSMSSQSKVLNEQIKNQKEKIATLKGALQEASEKYGENDKRMNKVREIPGQMWGIGKNIVSGIWSGISNSIGWITSKVREFARGILDGMKSALGIHSPSTVFE